ncbi:hypothetical protein [Zeimonas arvi]|uniref:Uncharacterized protein n=1 Tax=Zeimonas arvi TaxID=2498847 RepID=A0A5C8P4V1_9BURK|nr:hypothetical protein [Zeimonas arvi]TXL68164.1 hypothetical protein FHP08_00205 [Zeimonas arvi]
MSMRRLILPLALLIGVAAYASLLSKMRHGRRRKDIRRLKMELDVWEGEGGSPVPPSTSSSQPT